MDPLDRIAEAVEVKSDLQEIKADLSGLTAHIKGHLSQQLAINERMERQLGGLANQSSSLRERVTRIESDACRVPILAEKVADLENRLGRYVAWVGGVAALASLVISLGVQLALKFMGN